MNSLYKALSYILIHIGQRFISWSNYWHKKVEPKPWWDQVTFHVPEDKRVLHVLELSAADVALDIAELEAQLNNHKRTIN